MKTITTSLLLLLSATIMAQEPLLIGTESFEDWEAVEAGELPNYWDGFNRTVIFGGMPVGEVVCVYKDSSDPKDGDYSVRLVSSTVVGGPAVSGMLTAGDLNIDFETVSGDVTGGMAYSETPYNLSGWYKYEPNGVDTAIINVWFMYGGETISGGEFLMSDMITEWTPFTIDLVFPLGAIPDSVNVLFSSSKDEDNVSEGSTLQIDAIKFNKHTAGIDNIEDTQLSISPNPTSGILTLQVGDNTTGTLNIFDLNGKNCLTVPVTDPTTTVMIESLPSGTYLAVFVDNNQTILSRTIVKS